MIDGIDSQPGADNLMAAYRPIVFDVVAFRTDGDPRPPVVYCDIYFNGIFYKTLKKSMFQFDGGTSGTLWRFDIQDAAQEYLDKYLGHINGTAIEAAAPLIAQAYCKFRSSGYDTEGFVVPEGTAPIQATGGTGSTAGDGTQSETFYILNATLQHEDNQVLAAHLRWINDQEWAIGYDTNTYPLTHRPLNYFVCQGDSDFFPILTDKTPSRIQIFWQNKDGSEGSSTTDPICVPVAIASFSLPNAQVGIPYSVTIPLSGSSGASVVASTLPSWMSAEIDGNNLVLSGTPDAGGTGIEVSVTVQNCGGDGNAGFDKFINVTTCTPVSFGLVSFADAIAGQAYSKTVPILGSGPFVIDGFSLPGWMTVALVGSNLIFTGTPTDGDVDTGETIDVVVLNCGNTQDAELLTTINVLTSQNFMLDAAWNFKINSVTGSSIPAIGPTTVNGRKTGHQTGMSGTYTVNITGTTVAITSVIVYINGAFSQCQNVSTSIGTSIFEVDYSFTITASESDQVKISIANFLCD